MYRDIVEDYSAIPRYLQQLYIKSLIAGTKYGRIWRIVADGSSPPHQFDLTQATTQELVGQLSNGNYLWRSTAQRLLIERGDSAATAALELLVRKGPTPQARLHAIHALDGMGVLEPTVVEDAIALPRRPRRARRKGIAEHGRRAQTGGTPTSMYLDACSRFFVSLVLFVVYPCGPCALATVNAYAHSQRRLVPLTQPFVDVLQAVEHSGCRGHCPIGVACLFDGHTKQGHEPVAEELVDDAAVVSG
jgi:hypothetical protein